GPNPGRQASDPRVARAPASLLRQVLLPLPEGPEAPGPLPPHPLGRPAGPHLHPPPPPRDRPPLGRQRPPGPAPRPPRPPPSPPLGANAAAPAPPAPARGGPCAVMPRFRAYAEKVFRLSESSPGLTASRPRPQTPPAAAFAGGLTLFPPRRGSLNGLEQDLRFP